MNPAAFAPMVLLAAGLVLIPAARAADDPAHHHHHQDQPAAQGKPGAVQVKYADTTLVNQDGKKIKLKSEVFGNRLVVMDFAYTSCTTVCPVLTAVLVKVQAGLGDKAGKDVQLVTMTVDPARDTPARLKEYAGKHGAKAGWIWLTGPVAVVNEVLRGFDAYAPNFEDHPAMILVGDPVSGNWTRFYGFSDPKDVLAKVEELRAARGASRPAS
ncbi:MAG TPA: SCO family protein [Burkholderiales bacterium]|nr:SCO family protein [Burkholderiales bacterium]